MKLKSQKKTQIGWFSTLLTMLCQGFTISYKNINKDNIECFLEFNLSKYLSGMNLILLSNTEKMN